MSAVPYQNEFAPRLGHVPSMSNSAIQEAMSRWEIPVAEAEVSQIEKRLVAADSLPLEESRAESKFAFAFDGSDLEIPAREEYPSVTVGFLQIAGALVDLEKFFNSYDRNLVDPRLLRQAMEARSINSVLPGSMVVRPGLTGIQTWRVELDDMFAGSGFTESGKMYSLRDALMSLHGSAGKPADSISLRKCPTCKGPDVTVEHDGSVCPHCGESVYVTDVLRTHDEYAEAGSNIVPFTRVMNAAERLLCLGYMDWLFVNYPGALSTTLFIQDGPLSFFGTTAPLKRRWIAHWSTMCDGLKAKGHLPPLVVGIEKSGIFVEHANSISRFIPNGHLMVLDNDYIQSRIRAQDVKSAYGKDEFYGRRFYYKTSTGQMLVLTLPKVPGGHPYEEFSQASGDLNGNPNLYPTLRATVEALDRVQTRLYSNAVIPVALAHEAAALPLGTGSHVLTLMAKKALRLP